MNTPPHVMHLYQKPIQGAGFIKRYATYNYRHKISAIGWFDTASCDLAMSRKEADLFVEGYMGNRVAFYVDNPMEPIWEGIVSRMTFQVGDIVQSRSLEKMANRIALTYQNPNAVAPKRTTTTYLDDTDSQARYGIKEEILQLNVDPQTGTTRRDALRATRLAVRAWPQNSATSRGAGQAALLHLEFMGFYRTLDWDHYNNTATTTANADVIVKEVVQANINGATFFDDTDVTQVAANAAFVMSRECQTGMTRWQYLQTIQQAGDGANRWIMGIGPTDPNLGTRVFYYRQASTAVKYATHLREGSGFIRNLYGQRVDLWRIVPDGSIRLQDVLVGWEAHGTDPRLAYLASITYDAEQQTVSWQSEDDITLEGIFQLSTVYNPVEQTAGVAKAAPISFYG